MTSDFRRAMTPRSVILFALERTVGKLKPQKTLATLTQDEHEYLGRLLARATGDEHSRRITEAFLNYMNKHGYSAYGAYQAVRYDGWLL